MGLDSATPELSQPPCCGQHDVDALVGVHAGLHLAIGQDICTDDIEAEEEQPELQETVLPRGGGLFQLVTIRQETQDRSFVCPARFWRLLYLQCRLADIVVRTGDNHI